MRDARRLRLLVVTLRYPPYVGGGYEWLTADAVNALTDRGHTATVLVGRGKRFEGTADVLPWLDPDLDDETEIHERSFQGSNTDRLRLHFFSPANYAATNRAIDRVRPDLLLVFNLGFLSLAPLVAARHRDLPTLVYAADRWPANHWIRYWEEDAERSSGAPWRLGVLRRAWAVFRELVRIGPGLVPSAFLRAELLGAGASPEDWEVLPLGLSPELARRAARSEPARRQPAEPLRVLCTSSLWEGKGQHVLVDAVARARVAGSEVRLGLAGDGTPAYRAALRARVHALGLSEQVEFFGALDRRAVAELLTKSHVLCLPSLWGEPFGLATVEGMAYGLAVVASDSGASPELLEDEREGALFKTGEADDLARILGHLAGDEERRLALGAAARVRAQRDFSHESFVDGLEARLQRFARTSA